MKINEILKKDEELYDRKRYVIGVEFDTQTPSREELTNMIAAKYSAKKDKIIIRNINTDYGLKKAKVEFLIYNKVKDLKRIELKHYVNRNTFEKDGDDNDE